MIVYEKEKFAFLHINKTGGTSVKTFLENTFGCRGKVVGSGGPHYLHEPLKNKFKLYDLSDFNICSFIRNPYARMYSIYLTAKMNYSWGKINDNTVCANKMSFANWYKQFAITVPYSNHWFNSISEFVLVDDALPKNLTLFRMEDDKNSFITYVSEAINKTIKSKFPHVNKFSHSNSNFIDALDDYVIKDLYLKDKFIFDSYYKDCSDVY